MAVVFANPFGSFLEGFRFGEDDEYKRQQELRKQRAQDLDYLLRGTERQFVRDTSALDFQRDLQTLGKKQELDLERIRVDTQLQSDNADLAALRQQGLARDQNMFQGIMSGQITGDAAESYLESIFGTNAQVTINRPVYDANGNITGYQATPLNPSSAPNAQGVPQPTAVNPAAPGTRTSLAAPSPTSNPVAEIFNMQRFEQPRNAGSERTSLMLDDARNYIRTGVPPTWLSTADSRTVNMFYSAVSQASAEQQAQGR